MTMAEFFEFFFFVLLSRIARLLPFGAAGVFGSFLGNAVFLLTGLRKRVTMENLTRAFPGLSDQEIRRIARGAFKNYAIALTEMLWSLDAEAGELKEKVRVKNAECLHAARARGKGVVLLSAHFGSWEFLLSAFRLHFDFPFYAIVQHQRNRRIDALIDASRRRFGNIMIPMGPTVREVMKALQMNNTVLMLGDQSGPKESVFIDFFGRPAATHRGAAAFSLKIGSPIIMALLIRQSDGKYEAALEEVDRSGLDGYSEEHVVELTRRHAAVLERFIRQHPDHWLWMHKRWKHTGYFESLHTPSSSVPPVAEGV